MGDTLFSGVYNHSNDIMNTDGLYIYHFVKLVWIN